MLQGTVFWVTLTIIVILFIYVVNDPVAVESFSFCGRKNLNRRSIWDKTRKRFGFHQASKIMPTTYLLPSELRAMLKDPSQQFILKTLWSGKRVGVKLYDCKNNIQRDQHKYSVGQVYIKNPLLINGYKFDVRFFLVVHCGLGAFLYLPGYCVYTYKPFKYQGLDRQAKINQVDTKDSHYDIHKLPRLFSEIQKMYPRFNSSLVIQRLIRNLRMILTTSDKMCCNSKGINFHIFGVDIEITSDLEPLILEINSDPLLYFNENWKKRIISPMLVDLKQKKFTSPRWRKISGAQV